MRTREEQAQAITGGIVAGLIGGAALTVWMLLVSAQLGVNVWVPLKGPATPFLGERATQPGFDLGPVVLGLLVHYTVSVVWAVLFALLFYGFARLATVALGGLWGLVVWLAMFYAVLPTVGLGQAAAATPVSLAVLEHLLYGLALGIGFAPSSARRRRPASRLPPVPRGARRARPGGGPAASGPARG